MKLACDEIRADGKFGRRGVLRKFIYRFVRIGGAFRIDSFLLLLFIDTNPLSADQRVYQHYQDIREMCIRYTW